MMKFQHGKSYIGLFPVFCVLFFGGCVLSVAAIGNPGWGVIVMPAFMAFLFASELRSAVALDSWWRATYREGCWQYKAIISLHAAVIVVFSILAYIFI
jgi:hypothetical protein